MNINKEELYYIMSVNVVAYMKANKINYIGEPELLSDGKIKWYFEDTEEFRNLLNAYGNNEFLQAFIGSLRQIKADIRNLKRQK
jgi:hypothetical protein